MHMSGGALAWEQGSDLAVGEVSPELTEIWKLSLECKWVPALGGRQPCGEAQGGVSCGDGVRDLEFCSAEAPSAAVVAAQFSFFLLCFPKEGTYFPSASELLFFPLALVVLAILCTACSCPGFEFPATLQCVSCTNFESGASWPGGVSTDSATVHAVHAV